MAVQEKIYRMAHRHVHQALFPKPLTSSRVKLHRSAKYKSYCGNAMPQMGCQHHC